MQVNWDYIAGFFDGEGSVSTMNFTHRDTLAATIVTLSQTGELGLALLESIRLFLLERGIKGYVHTQKHRKYGHYRPMSHLKISARADVMSFLREMRSRVVVKKQVAEDTLRFSVVYPQIRSATTANRNRERGKQGALNLNADDLMADRVAGMSMKDLAAKHGASTYTIRKYLDPDYRKRYDAYRKAWRAEQVVKAKAARVA